MSASKKPRACVFAAVTKYGDIIRFYDTADQAFFWTANVGDSVVRFDRKRVVRVRKRAARQ